MARAEEEVAHSQRMCIGCTTRLWHDMASNEAFVEACPTITRLPELALVMLPVYVEDERLFSALKFIRSSVHNRLKHPHLSVASRLFFSDAIGVVTFPYDRALEELLGSGSKHLQTLQEGSRVAVSEGNEMVSSLVRLASG
eukprot:354416-Chlamydomonas_euryale.AAC.9